MRRCLAALALAAAACSTKDAEKVDSSTAPAAVAAAPANTKADEDSIRAISKRWLDMTTRHDTTGIGALFMDDGVEYFPHTAPARGAAAISAAVAAANRQGTNVQDTFETTDVSVAQSGDLAVERGTYRVTFTDSKGKAHEEKGNYVTTWKKQNGAWKVAFDISTPETPAPSA